jgi:DUF4097 and DUF4098 domain-containing protein YvlB
MSICLKCKMIMAFLPAFIVASLFQVLAADHIAIPVSNPLKAITVKVSLSAGSISVTGYSGKEVLMDVQSWTETNRRPNRSAQPGGSTDLKRISSPKTGLAVQEENNVVTIGNGAANQSMNLALHVPLKTKLVLDMNGGGNISVNAVEGDVRINSETIQPNSKGYVAVRSSHSGNIEVHQVKGDVEINSARGSVTLDKISGSAIAYVSKGDLRASFLYVKPGKPMSFSSMNGMIDVWLPPDIKANVTMQSAGGEVHSDFDVKIDSTIVAQTPTSLPQSRTRNPRIRQSNQKNGNLRIQRSNQTSRTVIGKINGGGSEIQLKTYKGNIYIRKFSDALHKPQRK